VGGGKTLRVGERGIVASLGEGFLAEKLAFGAPFGGVFGRADSVVPGKLVGAVVSTAGRDFALDSTGGKDFLAGCGSGALAGSAFFSCLGTLGSVVLKKVGKQENQSRCLPTGQKDKDTK